MMPRIGLPLLSLIILAPLAHAAEASRSTITIVGNGEAKHAPEYAALTVSVASLCYDHPTEAEAANNELSKSIVTLLQGYATHPAADVTATGGASQLKSETYYANGQVVTLCSSKWHTDNQINIRRVAPDKIAEVQAAVIEAIEQHSTLNPQQQAQTYADVSAPSFTLSRKTTQELETKADNRAYEDAQRKRDDFAKRCGFQDLRLQSVQPPEQYVFAGIGQSQQGSQGGGPGGTIIPQPISVTASWQFVWSFEPGSACVD